MTDLEIPLGKRTKTYRFFEMVPALMSYASLVLLVLLSFIQPLYGAIYLMLVIVTVLVRAVGVAYHTIMGRARIDRAVRVNWHERLTDLENPKEALSRLSDTKNRAAFGESAHIENLQLVSEHAARYPKPSSLYNAVIIAAYNESMEILQPTLESIVATSYDKRHLIIVLAYEQRGGAGIEQTAKELQRKYQNTFKEFHLVRHPSDLPHEVVGKGGNITYAGKWLEQWLHEAEIPLSHVIVTTLDSDNRPHKTYFDYLTYEYIVHEDRKHLAYQPVSLFLNNIWDAPAPMRVVATGNSFWNIISSMRPHTLRNFASHAQPMDALAEMNFWSTRTIVEDGHQYWRSYFYFDGDYAVTPLYVPIYQDAVLSDTYLKTLKAQFIQLRRWAYGASDVPYVATRIFTRKRTVPFWGGLARLIRLLDGHVTLASNALLITFGGWVPLFISSEASHSVVANQLPQVISVVQRIAMVGLFITVFLSFKMLPPRPERYKRHRTVFMLLQWILMPVTSICYSTISALYSQTRLLTGRYLDKFDVTEKATVDSVNRAKKAKVDRASVQKQ